MMKNIIYKILLVALVGVFATSCELDRFPADSVEQSQSFQTMNDAKAWNNGVYSLFRNRQGGIYTYSTDVQADQLNASIEFGNRNGAPHRWDFLADDYTIRDVWQNYYYAINNINIVLDGYPNIAPATDAERATMQMYTGDAHFARAYYYHQLALFYAKPYDPAGAASTPGVPLILDYDLTLMPARASLKEVYDQVLADLSAAATNLANVNGKPAATYFNKDVIKAMQARVKLHMKDWAGAYADATSLINSGTYKLISTQEGLTNLWHNDNGDSEVIFEAFTSKPSELGNTNAIYLGFNPATKKYTADFLPAQWVVDMYADNDLRKEVFFEQKLAYYNGKDYPNIWFVNKYPGNPELWTGASTNYAHAPKVFRIAEQYLIAAEAAYNLNNPANALTYLNALRVARGLSELSGISGAALFQEIKNERFRELAFEGFRLFDLKRWNDGFQRKDPQNAEILTAGPNYFTKSVGANDPKFVWGIPTNDITVNPNIVQNPGW